MNPNFYYYFRKLIYSVLVLSISNFDATNPTSQKIIFAVEFLFFLQTAKNTFAIGGLPNSSERNFSRMSFIYFVF